MKKLITVSCFVFFAAIYVTATGQTKGINVEGVYILSASERASLRSINESFSSQMKAVSSFNEEMQSGQKDALSKRVQKMQKLRFQRDSAIKVLLGKNYDLYYNQSHSSKGKRDSIASNMHNKGKVYKQKLKLTAQQSSELETLLLDYDRQKKSLVNTSSGSAESVNGKILDLKKSHEEKIKDLLSTEQFQAFKNL